VTAFSAASVGSRTRPIADTSGMGNSVIETAIE
jgi:hypothetical protein